MINDSGNIRSFGDGNSPVRDMGENKGRFDLVPLDVMGAFMGNPFVGYMWKFQEENEVSYLYDALDVFCTEAYEGNRCKMMLEVAKHYEEGCKKYGTDNWKRGDGIPTWSYIDSTCRHYLKWLDGQIDESHDRAVTWNLMGCIWQVTHHAVPEVIEELVLDDAVIDDLAELMKEVEKDD